MTYHMAVSKKASTCARTACKKTLGLQESDDKARFYPVSCFEGVMERLTRLCLYQHACKTTYNHSWLLCPGARKEGLLRFYPGSNISVVQAEPTTTTSD